MPETDAELKAVKEALAEDKQLTAILRDFEEDMARHAVKLPSGQRPNYRIVLKRCGEECAVIAQELETRKEHNKRMIEVITEKRAEISRLEARMLTEIETRRVKINNLTQLNEAHEGALEASEMRLEAAQDRATDLQAKLAATEAKLADLRAKLQAQQKKQDAWGQISTRALDQGTLGSRAYP